ncbi:MAG TPA: acetyl/propionyl/methylcrotonyl-CoA carboxylase subunit alpha [Aestuariivirgaceae bacterium]|nr:acetyl/propionyl/methylcrotonyl-CoA carboxylase subunit alpha [Aestuariivirgaceae bacterium]
MFSSVLIANRGEIACRIARTARRMGLRVIAVYSEAEPRAMHVREADEAYLIGPAAVGQSYLNAERILAVAKEAGADCIHPGYGFLAENAEFAEVCAAAGIAFVGPPPEAIRAMGLKDEAKRLMEKAGVPVVPGYLGDDQDASVLARQAGEIGYPVLIKAVAGGGGKGMRRVERAGDFAEALEGCRREAQSAFGNDRMLIEKYVTRPRHIEIQVFADMHDACVHLFERDCSLQRRHQKVIEEAPAPGMPDEMRAAMGAAAVAAAKAVGYVGAGTVEFIADASNGLKANAFYFMEMNTRLQVEHPVTEMITGLDLVELQLRAAAGEPLGLTQGDITMTGHAVEARLYAEDPASGFLPQSGRLHRLAWPDAEEHLRIDTGVEQGAEISAHYDPMIAKLITWGTSRQAALTRLARALERTEVAGLRSNIGFLERLVRHPGFVAGEVDTGFIDGHLDELVEKALPPALMALAAEAWLLRDANAEPASPWQRMDGWRLAGLPRTATLHLGLNGAPATVAMAWTDGGKILSISGEGFSHELELADVRLDGTHIEALVDGRRLRAAVTGDPDRERLFVAGLGRHVEVAALDLLKRDPDENLQSASLAAPMSGKIVRVFVKPGDVVAKGDRLLILEAMKMEHAMTAGFDAVVTSLAAGEGDQVAEGQVLAVLEAATGKTGDEA